MLNLNSYIIEKLKINKDIKLDDITSKIEEDLLEYLHQYDTYKSKWDIKVGETLKDWVKKYNINGVKVYAPVNLISKIKNIKLDQDFVDKAIGLKEWEKMGVYKSNYTRAVYLESKDSLSNKVDFISIWYDEEGYELHISDMKILLKKLNINEI